MSPDPTPAPGGPRPLARLPLATAADVVAARQEAHRLAALLGLERPASTRLATAVSEVARNAFAHARGGVVELAVDDEAAPQWLCATVTDQGPGIADLQAVLEGRRAAPAGTGFGLLSARRLVDRFDVASGPQGTRVHLAQRIPAGAARRLAPALLRAVAQASDARSADPLAALHEQNREILESLSQLQERQAETERLNRELEETNRGVVALYSELDEKAEALRRASEMKSRFLSHMSHEFRTPLNSILALSRLLIDQVDGPLNAEQLRQAQYVRSSAQGLLEMVNDLLDLAKVEAGRLELRPGPVAVAELLAGLRGLLKPLQVHPGVELRFEDAPRLPPLWSDEGKLAQVLRNLISNALKFTEHGQVSVSVRHEADAGRVVFSVSDTGIGIAAEHLETVFEEFSQVDGALQRGGTGLGLPLSRRLAQLMGGDVTVRSQPGMGSTFELWVPARFASADEDGGVAPLRTRRLLVVDDEEPFRYVVRQIAAGAGWDVAEAADGEQGLQQIRESRPDAVILDLEMPRLDGFAVLRALAARPDAPPVVVCTSRVLQAAQLHQLAAARAVLPKHEVSRERLVTLLASVTGQPFDAAA